MDKEATLDVVESSLDAVEDAVDTVKKVSPSRFNMNGMTKGQQVAILAGAALLGAAAGSGLTYILTKKHLTLKYEEIAKQEIEDAKQFYRGLNKIDESDEPLSPQQVMEKRHGKGAAEALISYQGRASATVVETPVPREEDLIDKEESAAYLEQVEGRVVEQTVVEESTNVFDEAEDEPDTPGWDHATEMARRTGDKPYIISEAEFLENEVDYEQVQVTYYEGDDVLVDEQDIPIPDSDASVGDDNLTRFGHGSNDENLLYVRNDSRGMDYEIVRSEGKYAHEVLGFDTENELRHSHRPGLRKFRADDD